MSSCYNILAACSTPAGEYVRTAQEPRRHRSKDISKSTAHGTAHVRDQACTCHGGQHTSYIKGSVSAATPRAPRYVQKQVKATWPVDAKRRPVKSHGIS
eukprot:1548645-Pleurochrysis_carterae.AAC.1